MNKQRKEKQEQDLHAAEEEKVDNRNTLRSGRDLFRLDFALRAILQCHHRQVTEISVRVIFINDAILHAEDYFILLYFDSASAYKFFLFL